MQLVNYRVQMYKCVLDSGDIRVTPLTVMVGKNESGKTALLKALHKFNPFKTEPFSMPNEWPRAHRDKRSGDQVACSVTFRLTQEEKQFLDELCEAATGIEEVTISRDYSGKLEVHFPPEVFPERLHPNDIDRICNDLPVPNDPVRDEFLQVANQCRGEVIRLAHEGRFSVLADLEKEHVEKLQQNRSNGHPQHGNEDNFIREYGAGLKRISKALKDSPSIHRKAHEYVVERIPVFVYMDEYRTFKGTALLDQIHQRKTQNKLSDDDKTFLTILALSGLDIDEEAKKATAKSKDERQYDLSDAAATLTRKISEHWGQLKYEVDFRADGNEFFTFVKDAKDRALIKLEERSKGFQWFFSFDLLLMHETKGTLQDCVILLDEPGLHLHPEAQRDLLRRLDAYAEGNTLIYTTHSPFMINVQEPDRIRVISETDHGTVVTEDLTHTQPEAKLTLQAALGIGGETSYLLSKRNLVVEGVDDYFLITAFSNLFQTFGKKGLDEDVWVTPAGGASEVTYIATFMIGQGLEVVALYDSDPAGTAAKDKLVKSWLTRYSTTHATAIALGEAIQQPPRECGIEDLFPDDFYLKFVKKHYGQYLTAAGINDIVLPPGEMLCKRVEKFFEDHGLKFTKGSVAKHIRNAVCGMKSVDDLPAETRKKAEALLNAINGALTKKE